jgi:hypothetical protein
MIFETTEQKGGNAPQLLRQVCTLRKVFKIM